MTKNLDNFIAFILSNGRPDRVFTYNCLRKHGYTGKIIILVDNLDKTREEYVKRYGDQVYIFDKNAIAKTFDNADNFGDMRAIVYARNACFEVAKELKADYFIQLDDDYTTFGYRFNSKLDFNYKNINNLNAIFSELVEFHKNTSIKSIAFAQGGDYIGGSESSTAAKVSLKRKCMNSFICSTDRAFKFIGRVNEDVNTYTRLGSIGDIFFTNNFVYLCQKPTQKNSGGMAEMYLDSGTYLKSFYSIMFQPSSVKICEMGNKYKRLHHLVEWKKTVPKILNERFKK